VACFFYNSTAKRQHITSFRRRDRILNIANIHLTSNLRGDNRHLRRRQLEDLINHCDNIHINNILIKNDILLVGDTNFGERDDMNNYNRRFIDVWDELEKSPGYTYDYINNSLAKLISQNKSVRRYDRMMLSSNSLKASSISLIGLEAIDLSTKPTAQWSGDIPISIKHVEYTLHQMHLSDHYGLRAQFYSTSPIHQVITLSS
jgi:endonuclease/exonuclease/phosphatase family metal-dependent hydrolase